MASTAAAGALTLAVTPLAMASPAPAPHPGPPPAPARCAPEHVGPDWRWHPVRNGGYWQHAQRDRQHRLQWVSLYRDTTYCAAKPAPAGPRPR